MWPSTSQAHFMVAGDSTAHAQWVGMGGHVISCPLGQVIESQSNFNLQVSLV